jgi:hypothetical protein
LDIKDPTKTKDILEQYFVAIKNAENNSSLVEVLRSVFACAEQISAVNGQIAVENKRAIMALAIWAAGDEVYKFGLPRLVTAAELKDFDVVVLDHTDVAKHILVSAALTVIFGPKVTYSIGINREIEDSKTDSGFSFKDLAGNMVGIKLAEFATSSNENGAIFLRHITGLSPTLNIIPKIDALPEPITYSDFIETYDHAESAKFTELLSGIINMVSDPFVFPLPVEDE